MIRGYKGAARVAVLTFTEPEFRAACRVFKAARNIPQTAYFFRTRRRMGDHYVYDVVIRQAADRTNVASPEAATKLLEDFKPALLITIGTGGGIKGRDGTALGDVIIGDFIDYYEFRKLHRGRSMPRKLAHDHPSLYIRECIAEPAKHRPDWLRFVKEQRPRPGSPKVLTGNVAAGEKILSDQRNAYQRAVMREYDKALAFDTESFGVSRAVFSARKSVHYNPQYLLLRGISDYIDRKGSNRQRPLWTSYAAGTAAAFGCCIARSFVERRRF